MTAPEYLRVKAEELAALHTVSHVVDSKQLGQCTAPARLREIAQRFEAMERALDRLAMTCPGSLPMWVMETVKPALAAARDPLTEDVPSKETGREGA